MLRFVLILNESIYKKKSTTLANTKRNISYQPDLLLNLSDIVEILKSHCCTVNYV